MTTPPTRKDGGGRAAPYRAGHARRMIAKELEPYHRAIARRRVPRRGFTTNPFGQAGAPGTDVTNDAGNMTPGRGGLLNDSAYSTDIAGDEQGAGCLSLKTNTNPASGVVATPTIITGADGFRRQRLALSGAPGGTVELASYRTNGLNNLNNGVLTRAYDFEMVVELTNVSGVNEMFTRTGSQASDTPYFGNGTGNLADLWPDGSTETLFIYSTVPETFPANQGNTYPTLFLVFGGRTPGGTIDVSRMSMKLVAE